ncbi:TIGR03086 family metal-binding protein [Streptomyces sp. 549]|uniref:TIGR03086 family metal-binding protein n=1 Tax=Streptomyces sp. 549 TaxID=3049076 RepID=UPI0024C38AC4|nr:TIGR03086 family metal-binding protein [Streptomyces sp. 549]MDK1472495.1 TIGR03086 family metal-binding protein [Streptomyces sp. 549]
MEQLEAFDRAHAEFDRRVRAVPDDRWTAPTPCTEWSVRDLVNHLTAEHLWAPPLLSGATLEEVGDRFDGDVLGDDPAAAWASASAASVPAFHRPGALDLPVHTSGGRSPAEEYAWQMTLDLAVHAWDLARGAGLDDRLDPELAAAVLEQVLPMADALQGTPMFAAPVPVPADAPAQDQLLGLLGRRL